MWVNISDDLYVDRPCSVVKIFRIEEDNQTGQEHSLSQVQHTQPVLKIRTWQHHTPIHYVSEYQWWFAGRPSLLQTHNPSWKYGHDNIKHLYTMWVNISDDLYVDRPSSVVEIFRIEEDNQTGQEHSLSAINRSHRSLDMKKENHEKINIENKSRNHRE